MVAPNSLRVLLIGSGGREHALAWKLSQSPRVEHIHIVPGNGGTASLPKVENHANLRADAFEDLARLAVEKKVNLLVPGPEAQLVDGIVDYFATHVKDIRCFGPSKAAARLEGSKTYAKDFMTRHKIPTARYANFDDYDKARKHVDSVPYPIVIKANGLAAGKGVIIPNSKEEAYAALDEIMLRKGFGDAGDEIVIEEYLPGAEMSIFSFCDGQHFLSLPAAQDHKKALDGDEGLNTGGMGSYAPITLESGPVRQEIMDTILQPTLDGMRKDGHPFVGLLFTGIMMTLSGPRVLEYNVRFGDPETQSLLPLLENDLAELMLVCTDNRLDTVKIGMKPKFATTVVIAAGGYPLQYAKGDSIIVDDVAEDIFHFHAGTIADGSALLTNGGRVISSTAVADTLKEAVDRAYVGVRAITFENMQYRKDIAFRDIVPCDKEVAEPPV